MSVGRFASYSIREPLDECGVRCLVTGMRFDSIELRLTIDDYLDHRVQEWIARELLPRLAPRAGFKIEVVGSRWESKRDERTRPEHMAATGVDP